MDMWWIIGALVMARAVQAVCIFSLKSGVPPPPIENADDSWLRYPNLRNRRWEEWAVHPQFSSSSIQHLKYALWLAALTRLAAGR